MPSSFSVTLYAGAFSFLWFIRLKNTFRHLGSPTRLLSKHAAIPRKRTASISWPRNLQDTN